MAGVKHQEEIMEIFGKLIDEALEQATDLDIFTFAIYHDHESNFVSVCLDTEENSKVQLADSNKYSMNYFRECIREGDIEQAKLWQANIGRNLSLGDFAAVNIAEKELGNISTDNAFYIAMVKAIENKAGQILKLSSHGSSLLFCCSTEDEEVGLTWVQENA